jgi:transposase
MQPATSIRNRPFVIPGNIPEDKQTDYCLSILDKYRKELKPLRKQISDLLRWKDHWREKAVEWEDKYKKSQEENREIVRENEKIKEKIGKLEKENNRYKIALFDHGNFKKLDRSKKKKGGQPGHPNTNRETHEDYLTYKRKRIFLTHHTCKNPLKRVNSTKQKILLDIVINPQVVKLILESERQWCGNCNKEVSARDQRSLPFTEYGINTFMMILLLRYRCCLSLSKTAMVLRIGYGLNISKSGVKNLLTQSKKYLKIRYNELIEIIRKGEIMYNDETGWKVRKKPAWMWIMANENITVYYASESRGKGIFEDMYSSSKAYSMHDGYRAYTKIPKEKTMYCWSHILRFAHEEAHNEKADSQIVKLKNELVDIYHLKDTLQKSKLETILREKLKSIIKRRFTQPSAIKVQNRVSDQKEGLINALLYTKDGTNNLAERELRQIVLSRKISFGSDTYEGMETAAVLASVVQTIYRDKNSDFFAQLTQSIRKGVSGKYPHLC